MIFKTMRRYPRRALPPNIIPHLKTDLLEHKANEAVEASSRALAKMYFDQVYPRETQ